MRLLVAGADRVDAGKTTFTLGLLERAGATGFKPRAGNDFWYHQDDCRTALGSGRLYGKDARRLAAASRSEVAPEEINPIHRLWRPSPGGGTGLLGQDDREFVVDRVGEEFVVNGTVAVPDAVTEALPLAEATRVHSLEEFNDVMRTAHVPVQQRFAERIDSSELAVVESYGDVARPYPDVDPDGVAVVEPARARIYDGDRYGKACRLASGDPREGQLEERVSSVIELIDPVATVALAPLGSDERSDPAAIERAYGPAYDALLDAVDR